MAISMGPYTLIQELRGKATHLRRFQAEDPAHERVLELRGPATSADAVPRELYLQEARELAALDHPAFLPVLDRLEVKGELFYAVPLRVDRTLEGVLDDPDFGFEARCEVIRQLAEALRTCHEAGLVLGGLDPALLAISAREGRVYWVNHRAPRQDLASGETRHLPPDCQPGARATARTDLFWWGRLAYWLLSRGSVPYARKSGDVSGLLGHIPDFPSDLAEVLEGCLARMPEARLPDAVALHAQLMDHWSALGGVRGTLVERPPAPELEAGRGALVTRPGAGHSLRALDGAPPPRAGGRALAVGVVAAGALAALLMTGSASPVPEGELGLIREVAPAPPTPAPPAPLSPERRAELREDPGVKRLLGSRPLRQADFPGAWERLRQLGVTARLPPTLNDPERILGLRRSYRRNPRAGVAALEGYLQELATSLQAG